MRSAANAALATRDPALRGLATLLDGAALAAALRAALPEAGIRAAEPRYVRYKPGTSCTVALTIAAAGGEATAYARAYAPQARGKLDHARRLAARGGALGPAALVLDELDIAVYSWPYDRDLPALRSMADQRGRRRLLAAAVPGRPWLREAALHTLHYKPERRYVGLLCGPAGERAVARMYAPADYPAALAAARLGGATALPTPALLGAHDEARLLIVAWLPGRPLADLLRDAPERTEATRAAGAALAALHVDAPPGLPPLDQVGALAPAAAAVAAVSQEQAGRAGALAAALRVALAGPPGTPRLVHGDCYADQLLAGDRAIALIDLDSVAAGDPAADLGSFIAHLHHAGLAPDLARRQAAAMLDGYLAAGGRASGVDAHVAATLLRLAAEPFRYCEPGWPARMRRLLDLAEEYLSYAPIAF